MIPGYLSPLANHLWQSTLFTLMVSLTTLALRKNRAAVRSRLWIAASLKFLLPFSLLISLGNWLPWHPAVALVETPVSSVVGQISRPFEAPGLAIASGTVRTASLSNNIGVLLLTVWLTGFSACVLGWSCKWWRIRIAIRRSTEIDLQLPIRTVSIKELLEPGVFGIFRPTLVLPDGIRSRLTPAQFDTIISHELCHVRRADNLVAAVHMLVEALFWFHPLVWWMEGRLIEELERACDEEVLRQGSEAQTYAEAILKVCEIYVTSPIRCVAGATGGNLKKRIQTIMSNQCARPLGCSKTLLLASMLLASVAGPIIIGALDRRSLQAQSTAEPTAPVQLAFEVASIKASPPGRTRDAGGIGSQFFPGGRIVIRNNSLKDLIGLAFHLKEFQVTGGPKWADPDMMTTTDRYVIEAKTDETATRAQIPLAGNIAAMLQTLLADRFKLQYHFDTKEYPIYELVVAKNGAKLGAPQGGGIEDSQWRSGGGHLRAMKVSMAELAEGLSDFTGRIVVDKTGISGRFTFNLDYTPESFRTGAARADNEPPVSGELPVDTNGPSLFTALQDQLGLRLEAKRGPVPIFVIDSAERPQLNIASRPEPVEESLKRQW
jgi:bla regulator protein BlaR1